MQETTVCTAADAIYKLAAGNLKYLNAENGSGDKIGRASCRERVSSPV